MSNEQADLEQLLNEIKYDRFSDPSYPISPFALKFINYIKLVNNGVTENKSPIAHLEIIDAMTRPRKRDRVSIICFRGLSKTTLLRFLILYVATEGKLPYMGKIDFIVYVSDTIENGIRSMSSNLKSTIENSKYLQSALDLKQTQINLDEWTFVNVRGEKLFVKGIGVTGSLRGANRNNMRPTLLLIDDILTDANAKSPAILETIKECINDKLIPALHPNNHKIIWAGTPFNKSDPLTSTVSNPKWYTVVLPICEKFPCDKEEFIGAWEDRFDYEFVLDTYELYKSNGRIGSFNKEFMLRIVNDDDKLISDDQILWYEGRDDIITNKHLYSFYITTDFATSEKQEADYSVISVWCFKDNKWYWIDGILERQDFGKTMDSLFRLCKIYEPVSVAIEVSGQQGGFIPLIQRRMIQDDIYFSLLSDKRTGEIGIRPNKSKLERFNLVLHLFQNHRIMFPKSLEDSKIMREAIDELRYASISGFKSAHDDFIDTVSQLQFINEVVNEDVENIEEIVTSTTGGIYNFETWEDWYYNNSSNYASYRG